MTKYKKIVRKKRSGESRIVRVKTESSGLGALKTAIIMVIIFSQLALFIYLYIELAIAFRWYVIASFSLSLLTCLYVLSSDKNSLSKAVWIIFLLVFFVFGYAIYVISDERFFFKKARKRYDAIFLKAEKYIPENQFEKLKSKLSVINDSRYFFGAAKFIPYQNSSLCYFSSGANFFDDVLAHLKSAKNFVFMEFFIISDGVLMKRFFDVLSEKCRDGVEVRIIYDDMGSQKTLSRKAKKKLKQIGVKLVPHNRLLPIFSIGHNYRDHRKIIVIDGKIAYTGGCNFADEYINEKRLYGYWKDSGVSISGAAADAFTLFFLRQWEFITGNAEDYSPFFMHFEKEESDSLVIPYADGLDFSKPIAKTAYENIISSAEERIYIMTPYFILEDTLTNLIINKASSGVDVRIILPGVPDKALVYALSKSNAEKLVKHGVKLYYMKNSFVHSKLLLTENSVIIGSINMDLRSFYQQFECAVYTDDEKTMADVHFDFLESFRDSFQVKPENIKKKNVFTRAFLGLLRLFAPFM